MNTELLRILVADKLSEDGIAQLKELPNTLVDVKTEQPHAILRAIIADYHVVLVRSATQITSEVIGNATNLRLIGRAGIGIDNVDVEAASRAGIVVMNTPQGNATAAAEHAIALLMALARQIPQATASMRAGLWEKSVFKGVEVTGKTLGIIGLGNIGQIVCQRAKGLRMRVLAFDPLVTQKKANELGAELVALNTLFSEADFITIHAPLTTHTRYLINDEAFAQMKKGVRLINAARGGIVEEAALLRALEKGIVAGAALDVFEQEPPPAHYPLLQHPAVLATPHLGASTNEAQQRVAMQIAEQARDFLLHGEIRNAVNVPNLSGSQLDHLKPLMQMAFGLGSFLAQSNSEKPGKLTVTLSSKDSEKAQVPVLHSAIAGFLSARQAHDVGWLLAPHKAAKMGIEIVEAYKTGDDSKFPSVTLESGQHNITGTLFASKGPRIVEIDNYQIEALPSAYMLFLKNKDVPGVIGQIGTCLGKQAVNISRMQLGTIANNQAISLWNLDSPLSALQLSEIRRLDSISEASLITL